MNAEPRTLRTRAEEALASTFRAARFALPGGKPARALRERAFGAFEEAGLPHRRVEAWKYTDLRALLRTVPPLAEPAADDALAAVAEGDPLAAIDRAEIVIANGAYRPDLSDLGGLDGVSVRSLADVLDAEPERVGALFADVADPVVALNAALMAGGVVVDVAANAAPARPVEIVHLFAGEAASVYVRNVVTVGANAALRLAETHRGPDGAAYLVNAATELDIGPGGRVVFARLQAEGDKATHLASFAVRLGQDASIDHLSVNAGAAVARWQAFVAVADKGARVAFNGATMLSGAEHSDATLVLEHAEPHTASRELFKAVVDGRAQGAFQGRIVVRPGAQKTDAKMMSKAMLLSDEGEFAAKPELEIYADDVQCGHGATSGRIDPTQLFYLMARGVPRPEAERLLVEAFLDDAIDAIGDEALAGALKGVVTAWLAERGGGLG